MTGFALELTRDGNLYIFFHEASRLIGTGLTVDEAWRDFEKTLLDVYTSYKNTPKKQLTQKAICYLNHLEGLRCGSGFA